MSIKNNAASAPSLHSGDALHKIPLRITDTTLRDAHQSLWATRMRTSDMMEIIEVIDNVGYYSLEMWGGATFDVCLRFLREDPWERLKLIRSRVKKTPLQMLLRGQNLVGYQNYADDVVDRFIGLAHKNGIDIFRVFDALNDTRNLETAIRSIKKHGAHAQGTLAYTISPVHTVQKYVEYAKEQVALGIDSLCIKDMAGILSPIAAEALVKALLSHIDIPIQVHCHSTSGMATATYVEAVRAGAGAIDCAISSVTGVSTQPPVETLAYIFSETGYAAHLDLDAMTKVSHYFSQVSQVRLKNNEISMMPIDPGILVHQIPGGMISNFRSQLASQSALDRLPEVLNEVSIVRKDLGYPPLVTPTSQIIGTQAVMNVLSGQRYKMVPTEVKEYVRGMYGRSPAPISKEIYSLILGDEKHITSRPADLLMPMLPKAIEGIEHDLLQSEEDILTFCILPESAKEFFAWRKLPVQDRPPIPVDLETKQDAQPVQKVSTASDADIDLVRKDATSSREKDVPLQLLHTQDYQGIAHIVSQASGLQVEELTLRKADLQFSLRIGYERKNTGITSEKQSTDTALQQTSPVVQKEVLPVPPSPAKSKQEHSQQAKTVSAETTAYSKTLKAPLMGTFYTSRGQSKTAFIKVGDTVKKGDKVCIIEAMKLFNEIEMQESGVIVTILVKDGDKVTKGQPLIGYNPL